MTTTPRTPNELQSKLKIQMLQLTRRCDAYYEEGAFFEAYSIATIVRVLVHDTKVSISLLKQMGIKNTTRFLDSRSTGNLYVMGIMNDYGGLHPRTRMPHKQYSEEHHFEFGEWWDGQEFKVVGIPFTRKSLTGALANKEGGAHVSLQPEARIAALNRSRSPYSVIVGDESYPAYGAELASMCAIGEEILFTLTPEPENRKRMLWEPWQKPYYLSMEESDSYKDLIRRDLVKLDGFSEGEVSHIQKALISSARRSLDAALEIDCLTSEDCEVTEGVANLMKMADLRWVE